MRLVNQGEQLAASNANAENNTEHTTRESQH